MIHDAGCRRSHQLPSVFGIIIVRYVELTVDLRSDRGWAHVQLNDVAHAALLHYNLMSLPSMAREGHTYTGDEDGVSLNLQGRGTVHYPLVGELYRKYGHRPEGIGTMC